jgi:4-amino-4-deoxy-L-arabinose transferase-like glycosyltransferase
MGVGTSGGSGAPYSLGAKDRSARITMRFLRSKRLDLYFALASCIFFFCAGRAIAPHIGIENDEALFAQGIYLPRYDLFNIPVWGHRLPIMLMSYVGALKSWLYWPIFHVFGVRLSTLREPMLLAGVVSVWLFFPLLRRCAGRRAAVIGCSLLAVDSMYLVALTFDWGPVALQHLLIVGGTFLLVRFSQERRNSDLALGFFLFGLALWDKALAIWMLSGIAAGAVATYPRQVRDLARARHVGIAAASFVAGALPFLIFNVAKPFSSVQDNVRLELGNLPAKAHFLMETAGGPGLFGWLTAEDVQTPAPHEPRGFVQHSSAGISRVFGHPRRNLLLYGFILALLLTPCIPRRDRRILQFSLIAMAVAWVQMAITANAGASVHHTILLWPFPEMAIAVSFAAASRRLGRRGLPVAAAALTVMVVPGVLVMNEYFGVMVRNGGSQGWDDAVLELSDYLGAVPAKHVLCLDWGILDPLRLLGEGRLPLAFGNEEISRPTMNESERGAVRGMVSETGNVFVAHTREFEVFPGASDKLVAFAAQSGYERDVLKVIADRFGRPVFEVYRFSDSKSPALEQGK